MGKFRGVMTPSNRRMLAGLLLAVLVAPVATAFLFAIPLFFEPDSSTGDRVAAYTVWMLGSIILGVPFALFFVVIIGGTAVAVAHKVAIKSAWYYFMAGAVGGSFVAWLDAQKTTNHFNMLEATPFVLGGVASALTYWSIAER